MKHLHYEVSKGLDFKRLEGKTLVCDTTKNKAILLGEIETFIWENVEGKSIEDVIALAKENFDGENIEEDIKGFYDQMIENGMVLVIETEN